MSLDKIFAKVNIKHNNKSLKPAPFQSDMTIEEALICVDDLCKGNKQFANRLILTIGYGDWGRDLFTCKLSTKIGKRLVICSVDDFFTKGDKYKFDVSNLKWAHQQCQGKTCNALLNRSKVVLVANPNVYTDHINMYNQFKEDFILVQFIPSSVEDAVKMGESNSKNIPASVFEKGYVAMQNMDIHPEILPRMAALIRINVSAENDNEEIAAAD